MDVQLKLATPSEFNGPDDLGTPGDLEKAGFDVRVGDAPVAHRIERADSPSNDASLDRWHRRFHLWLIPYRLRVMRRTSKAEVMTVGIEAELCIDGSASCSIVSVFPTQKHVTVASADLDVSARAAIEASGEIVPLRSGDADEGSLATQLANLGGGVKIGAGFQMKFSSTLCTPYISAGGVGSRSCDFRFDHYREPLHGRDIECWTTVALSRHVKGQITYRVRFYVVTRQFFIAERYESSWSAVNCSLRA